MARPADFGDVGRLLRAAVGDVFPSAQVVILDAGEPVWAATIGDATDDTLFDIASLTKPLSTVTLCMLALERGQLRLGDQPRPACTVELLLSHASGLPAWRPLWSGARSRDEIVERARQEPLESVPGETARYSDLGFILLGDHLESRLGARLDALFAAEVAGPLGLGMRFLPEPRGCAPTRDHRQGLVDDDNARAMDGVAGHAGLFSTARDVAAYAAALLRIWAGTPGLVRPDTLRRFWSPSTVPHSTWCLGWDRPSAVGSSAGAAWPRDGVGHLGFTGCSLWLDPPHGRGVVILSNRVHPSDANNRIKTFRPQLHDTVSRAWA